MITYFPNTLEMRLIFSEMSNVYISVQKTKTTISICYTCARAHATSLLFRARAARYGWLGKMEVILSTALSYET